MSDLQILNDGSPVVVKLQNSDEIIGVLFLDEAQEGILIDRPLLTIREPIGETDKYIRYGLRFEKWIRSAGTNCVPLMDVNVLSIALVSDKMVDIYEKWADEHYEPAMPSEAQIIPGEEPLCPPIPATDYTGQPLTVEEMRMRDRLFQHILETFNSGVAH